MAPDVVKVIQESGQEAPEFLSGMVNDSDYNFGQGDDEPEHIYGNNPVDAPAPADAPNAEYVPNDQPQQNDVETINDVQQEDDWD